MVEFDFEKYLELEHKLRDIYCPYCGEKQDNETIYHHVTYWGEDGFKSCSCQCCGKDFEVEETVTRTFESRKLNGGE